MVSSFDRISFADVFFVVVQSDQAGRRLGELRLRRVASGRDFVGAFGHGHLAWRSVAETLPAFELLP